MSFILGKLTLNNFIIVEPKPDFPLIRVEIKGQSQRMLFLFETAGEHREFMEFMLRYIDLRDHNGIYPLSLSLSSLLLNPELFEIDIVFQSLTICTGGRP